jgi:hypothetical protein
MASKIVLLVSFCALARCFSDPYHPVVEEIIYDYEVSDGHPIPNNPHPVHPLNGHPNAGVNLDIKIPGVDQWKAPGASAPNGNAINFGGTSTSKSPLEYTQYFPVELSQCVGVPVAYECIKKNSGNCDMSAQDCLCKHMGNIYDQCFGGEKLTGASCQLNILMIRDQARQNATSQCKSQGLSAGARSDVNAPGLLFTLFFLLAFALI